MPAFQEELMFRTTGDLTVAETSAALTIYGTSIKGMAARIVVPGSTDLGAADTLQAEYHGSADGSTYHLFATSEAVAALVAGGEIITPIVCTYKYIKEELIVSATTTNFGAVVSGLVTGVGFNWDRAVSFE